MDLHRDGWNHIFEQSAADIKFWGHSSVGRALEWHSRGRRFDSAWLHQILPIPCWYNLTKLINNQLVGQQYLVTQVLPLNAQSSQLFV